MFDNKPKFIGINDLISASNNIGNNVSKEKKVIQEEPVKIDNEFKVDKKEVIKNDINYTVNSKQWGDITWMF